MNPQAVYSSEPVYSKALLKRAASIRLVVFDVDGVLTDGHLYIGPDGQEYKAFHSHDGLGIRLLLSNNIEVALISGRFAKAVEKRAGDLGICHLYQNIADKSEALTTLLARLDLHPEQVAYVGDDVIDLPALTRVGLAIAVADANPTIIPYTHWQTTKNGGQGAAREVCELVLRAQQKWEAVLTRYL